MLNRQIWKRTLSFARVRLLYTRITLTRFTTAYFFLAIVTCIVLGSLQGVTFADNSLAVRAIATVLDGQPANGLIIMEDGKLQQCTSIPHQAGAICTDIIDFQGNLKERNVVDDVFVFGRAHVEFTANLTAEETVTNEVLNFGATCVPALRRLDDVLHDAEREDVVTFLFQIWLFFLAFVLNESIPHLIAAVLGHVLGSCWAVYRVQSTVLLRDMYRDEIVPQACGGVDLLGNWWEIRIEHAIPIVVVNALTLVAFLYLSLKLFKVYANQSFSRVGAEPRIHNMYKIVLVFSVLLQLSGFFSLASTSMWIDKICHGMLLGLATHSKLYLAAFVVVLVLQVPWLVLGWICVRKECKIRFAIFLGTATFLLGISTTLFFSPLYRFIFLTWPFFATVTVTSYVHILATTMLAIVCRLNFEKGLGHYLRVTEALEGVDFTPVYFSEGFEKESDPEKGSTLSESDRKSTLDSGTHLTSFLQFSAPPPQQPTQKSEPKKKAPRGHSVYSERTGSPMLLSSSPPLVSDLGGAPSSSVQARVSRRLSKAPKRVASMKMSADSTRSPDATPINDLPPSIAAANPALASVAVPLPAARNLLVPRIQTTIRGGSPMSTIDGYSPTQANPSPMSSTTSSPTRLSPRPSQRGQGLPASPRTRLNIDKASPN